MARFRRPPAAGLAALAVLAEIAVTGCSGLRHPQPVPTASPAPPASLLPWEVPPQALGTQRLFRMSYSGPEGEGSFRLTLRLAAGDRFQIQAVDPVGRSLWTLDVDGGQDLWLDHRNRLFCRPAGRIDLPGLPFGSFPLAELPALLLGRLPADPPAGAEPERQGDQVTVEDSAGRRWTATLAGGRVRAWTLWDGDEPAAWWAERDGAAVLSVRAGAGTGASSSRAVQLRWKEVLAERLARPLAPLLPPKGFRELTECAAAPGPVPAAHGKSGGEGQAGGREERGGTAGWWGWWG